jgi:hypothetical protein
MNCWLRGSALPIYQSTVYRLRVMRPKGCRAYEDERDGE